MSADVVHDVDAALLRGPARDRAIGGGLVTDIEHLGKVLGPAYGELAARSNKHGAVALLNAAEPCGAPRTPSRS